MTASMLRIFLFVFFAMLFAVVPAASADRVALVIGNGAYKFASALPNPVNDATDITEKLKTLDFEVFGGNDLDLAGMQGAMRQFAENSSGAKVVLFFYAGHGMEVNGKNYLIPIDAKLETATALSFEVVDANVILNIMVEEKRVSIALLDACRDNPLARGFKKKSRSAVGSGLADVKVDQVGGGGLLYGLATGPGDTAADGEGRNSPFTKALLKHIGTPGVEFEQMMKSVKRDVDTDTKGDQRPYLTSSLVDDLFLVPPTNVIAEKEPVEPAPAAKPVTNAASDWDVVKNSKSIAVLEAFVAKHSDDALYRGLAEERIAELSPKKLAVASPKAPAPVNNAPPLLNAETVTLVKVASGSFEKQGDKWLEKDTEGQTRFTFSVLEPIGDLLMLEDKSRDTKLQFDWQAKKIFFRVGSDQFQPLYDIISTSTSKSEGQDVAIADQSATSSSEPNSAFEETSPKTRTVSLGKWPEGAAFGESDTLWIAESGSRQISKIDLSTGEIVDKAAVGRLPVSMTSTPDGTVYAATFTDGKLWRQPSSGKGKNIWQLPSRAHVFIDIAASDSVVFAIHYTDAEQRMTSLTRIDSTSGKAVTSEPFIGEGRALRFAGGAAWVLMSNGTLAKHDAKSFDYLGGVDTNYFLWSLTANTQAVYTGGKTAQTPEGISIITRQDANDPQTRIEKQIESNELILTMAATDTHVAALGENGNVWIFDATDLRPLKHFNTGAQPRSALFHNGQLFITAHQGEGENGSLLIYDGLLD